MTTKEVSRLFYILNVFLFLEVNCAKIKVWDTVHDCSFISQFCKNNIVSIKMLIDVYILLLKQLLIYGIIFMKVTTIDSRLIRKWFKTQAVLTSSTGF